MARPLRIEFDGALYHVMSRGNGRQRIVLDDGDRLRRLDWLRRTVETYRWRLHAFALMNNHEHLFVETPEANLSAGMQLLNGSYTSYFNRRHGQVGHLFQGRFKAHLIEEEGYFLEVSRYIHLNPVRAKLVDSPEAYPWSSYPGYQRARQGLEWVTYERVLGEFVRQRGGARRAYSHFVRQALGERTASPFDRAVGGVVLGSQAFLARIRGLLSDVADDGEVPQLSRLKVRPSLEAIAAAVAEHFGQDAAVWSPGTRCDDASRAVAAYLGRRRFGYPAARVAAVLGYGSPSAVSHAVRRAENNTGTLRKSIDQISRALE